MTSNPMGANSRAVDRVLAWCAFYTRRIDSSVAEQRWNEITSDLHEHLMWATESGQSPAEIKRSITSRALRGAMNDLSWRRAQKRQQALADPVFARARRADVSVSSLLSVYAVILLAWGIYVCARVAQNVAWGYIKPWSVTSVMLLAGTALAACGVVLVARAKTRALGALWLALPTVILVHSGFYQLFSISATMPMLTYMAGWSLAVHVLVLGALTLLAAASVWTWPTRSSNTTSALAPASADSTERRFL